MSDPVSLKYFDAGSSNRDRNQYPNPYDFVIPFSSSNKGSTTESFSDPVLESSPYSGSGKNIFLSVTGVSSDETHITLDPDEININNYYINSTLQIGSEFRDIIHYDGVTKIAIVSQPFFSTPPLGTHYFTRKKAVYFNSDVTIYHTLPDNSVDQLNLLTAAPSPINDLYKGSYIRFTNGSHVGETALITSYTPFNTIPIWNQPDLPGSISYLDGNVRSFQFKPINSGIFGKITLNIESYDISNYRTLQILVRYNGLIVYTENFQVINTFPHSNTTFDITAGPLLIRGEIYSIILQDISPTIENGYISIFGIPNDLSNITENLETYPQTSIDVYPPPGNVSWTQPDILGFNSVINTTNAQLYNFIPTISGNLSNIILRIISFETVSLGRTINIKLYSDTDIIYQGNFVVSNISVQSDIDFSITGPKLNVNSTYVLSLLDITPGGLDTGYINLFGLTSSSPKMSIFVDNSIAWSQSNNFGVDEYISSTEQGFQFTAQENGILSSIVLFLTSFESVLAGRNLRVKLRLGSGIFGSILYTTNFIISNTNFNYYTLNIPSGPSISSNGIYTITFQDITSGGNGFINIYGVNPTSNISYNSVIYPYINLTVDNGGNSNVWNQSGNTINSIFSPGENGYLFIPSTSGRITSISSQLSTFGTSITWRLRIREGSGLNGNLLFTQDYVITTGMGSVTNVFSMNGPFILSGNKYTWTLEVISGLLSNARNIGITPTSTYISYNTSVYEMSSITVVNGMSTSFQSINDTKTDVISQSLTQGFVFVSSGDTARSMTSLDISLMSYGSRQLTIEILDGSTLSSPVLFSGIQIISSTPTKTLTNITLPFPVLIPGNLYTLTLKDTTGNNNGKIYFYGVDSSSYTVYNTNVYPQLNINISDNRLPAFIQSSSPTVTTIIDTVTEKGFKFIPTITGQISNIKINLTSFEAIDTSRLIILKIYNGSGIGGTVLFEGSFTIPNILSRTDYIISINSTILNSGNVYTYSIKDITPGGSATGNVYLYGIDSNLSYVSYNTLMYLKTSVNISTNIQTYIQNSNPTITDIVSTVVEKGFIMSPIFTATIAGVILNISSFDVSNSRTLNVKIREGNGLVGNIINEKEINVSNKHQELSVGFDISTLLTQDNIYTLTVKDVTVGGNGNMSVYGIEQTSNYMSVGTNVYPKFSTYGYTFIITIKPPKNINGFLGNSIDNIEFNSQAYENVSCLLYNGLPSTEAHYYKVGLKYLILPNQNLKSGYGGKFNDYPYVYVRIVNAGNRGSLNVMNSNNPNASYAIFKCPVDKNLYDNPSAFFTLKTTNKDQIIKFRPDQDIQITITSPSGDIIQNYVDDYISPIFPNPLLQLNALFTIYPVEKYDHIPV